jgi:hypothetical protein
MGESEVFAFDEVWQAGYEQCKIDDTKKVELALHVISYLVKENDRLKALLEAKNG